MASNLDNAKYELLIWDGSTTLKIKYKSLVTGLNADLTIPDAKVDLEYTPAVDSGSVGDKLGGDAAVIPLVIYDESDASKNAAGLMPPDSLKKLGIYPDGGSVDGEVVQWDATKEIFVAGTLSTVGKLDDLSDVTVGSPQKGQVLVVNPGTVASDGSDQYIVDYLPTVQISDSDVSTGPDTTTGTAGGIKLAEYIKLPDKSIIPSNLDISTDGYLHTTIPAALNYRNVITCLRTEIDEDTITIDGSNKGKNKDNIRTPKQTGDVYVNLEAGYPSNINDSWNGISDETLYQDAFATVSVDATTNLINGITLDNYQQGWLFESGDVSLRDENDIFAGTEVTVIADSNGVITIDSIKTAGGGFIDGQRVRILNNNTTGAFPQQELVGGELIAYSDDASTNEPVWRIIGKIGVDEVTAFVRLSGDTMLGPLIAPGITATGELTVSSGNGITVVDGNIGITSGSLSIQDGGISQTGGNVTIDNDVATGLAYYGAPTTASPDLSAAAENVLVTKKFVDDTVTSIGAITDKSLPIYEVTTTDANGGDPRILLSAVDGNNNTYKQTSAVTIGGGVHTDVILESAVITVNSTAAKVWEGSTPPTDPDVKVSDLWYNDVDGRLYFYYENGSDPAVWVDASPSAIDGSDYIAKAGDNIDGTLTFSPNGEVNGDNPGGINPHTFTCYHYGIETLPKLPVRA